jgi:hypothetical protein
VDTIAGADRKEFLSQADSGHAGKEVQDLLAGVCMVEHAIAGPEPLLPEIELGRAVGSVDEMLQGEIAGAASDRFRARDHS